MSRRKPWYLEHPETYRRNRAAATARNERSKLTASRNRQPWSVAELEAVMRDAPLEEIAAQLGRTVRAVAARRSIEKTYLAAVELLDAA